MMIFCDIEEESKVYEWVKDSIIAKFIDPSERKEAMKGQRRKVWIGLTGAALLIVVVMAIAVPLFQADFHRQDVMRAQALANTRVYVPSQPEMSVQVYDNPGEPSIGALVPFTKVNAKCVVTMNDRQYMQVVVDSQSAYFSGRRLYVVAKDVEYRLGAPNC